ncbi:MAG: aconitase family protein [Sandaracinaceae bacterium]|nr:aconitase family protein [Sandaracinaceae bacterium]MDW8246801.1 aconitase family protein [Sandaracinaceae bacterium]
MSLSQSVRLEGRVLFLTEDFELLRKQIEGEDLGEEVVRDIIDGRGPKLMDNISTDEITPGWVCFHYDQTLGQYAYVGLRGGRVQPGDIAGGGFQAIVSGQSKGCGSSREQAPYSEFAAGIRFVFARSIEKIYGQNCQNIGLLISTDFELLRRLLRKEAIPLEEFLHGLDPISKEIVRAGGLFAYNRKRLEGTLSPPPIQTRSRPMTMVEHIIAAHAVTDAKRGCLGVEAVRPGDALFVRTDVRFSHEYVTPMAEALFVEALGKDAKIREPESVFLFRDHLTFLDEVMSPKHRAMGLLEKANHLAEAQNAFARKHALKLYGELPRGADGRSQGSEAICHNAVLEEIALPGQVVVGSDSHTCMAGAVGALAFGIGATDMANAWLTQDVRVRVPETLRIVLEGRLGEGVTAKDVMLHLLSQPFFRTAKGIGKVLEFQGPGLETLPMDELATLTNMAVEAGGFTGILEPTEAVIAYLKEMRGLSEEAIRSRIVRSDPNAEYFETFVVDLAKVPVMVATPGDPRNGVDISELKEQIPINIAYGGSCTGGKRRDMDLYAMVIAKALARGRRVPPHVRAFIQFGSQRIRRYAEAKGYVALFEAAGIQLLGPSCGSCIAAGPGVSTHPDEITISAINRNFPGRSGPGRVYLASPLTVAASAIAGYIVDPRRFLEELDCGGWV